MGTGLTSKCACGYKAESSVGSSRRMHGKEFFFPHQCKTCSKVVSVDLLAKPVCCSHCGSQEVTSYAATTKLLDSKETLSHLDPKLLNRLGYHVAAQVVDSAFCYRLEKTFALTNIANECPSCHEPTLRFVASEFFD
jgi:hypothetical protein